MANPVTLEAAKQNTTHDAAADTLIALCDVVKRLEEELLEAQMRPPGGDFDPEFKLKYRYQKAVILLRCIQAILEQEFLDLGSSVPPLNFALMEYGVFVSHVRRS